MLYTHEGTKPDEGENRDGLCLQQMQKKDCNPKSSQTWKNRKRLMNTLLKTAAALLLVVVVAQPAARLG